jgi:hypothetical protein
MRNPLIPGAHEFLFAIGTVVWGVLMLAIAVAIVLIVVLLVRFLLVGTRAAKLYLAQHEPQPAGPVPGALPVVPPIATKKSKD